LELSGRILRLRSGFRRQAPATLTPAKRLKLRRPIQLTIDFSKAKSAGLWRSQFRILQMKIGGLLVGAGEGAEFGIAIELANEGQAYRRAQAADVGVGALVLFGRL